MNEFEYFNMMDETSKLIAEKKANILGNAATAYEQSMALTNEVEFWRWMGKNYPKDMGSTQLIQQAANTKGRWLNTQLQGKGYEWDYMALQRINPQKTLSVFEAGNCPTQPGIDITESGLLDGKVKATYQNKAYLSSNNPNLANTPKDAIVVTNKEKIAYVSKKGYSTEHYMDAKDIAEIRDSRFDDALQGKTQTNYTIRNVSVASIKAGVIGAVIGMTTESVISYKAWKKKEISDEQYIKEVLKAGGDAGITAGVTTVIMVPIQATITVAGVSNLLAIPVSIVLGSVINSVVAPCFGRGKYRQILKEAHYYNSMKYVYDDFMDIVEKSAKQYTNYITSMQLQQEKYKKMRDISQKMNIDLEKLYESI